MTHVTLRDVVTVFAAMSGGASLLLHLRPTMTREDVRAAVQTELERHVERVRQRLRPIPKRGGSDSAA